MAALGFLRLAELRTILLRDLVLLRRGASHVGPRDLPEAGLCGVCCLAAAMPAGQSARLRPFLWTPSSTGTSTRLSIRGPSGPGQTPGHRGPTRGDPDRTRNGPDQTPEGPREARRPGRMAIVVRAVPVPTRQTAVPLRPRPNKRDSPPIWPPSRACFAAQRAQTGMPPSPPTPVHSLSRAIGTVPQLWDESTVGKGKPAVQDLERLYGPAWRPSANERVLFSCRKVIIDEIQARTKSGRCCSERWRRVGGSTPV
jgi:transcriptional activator of glycolytic enzymes GCR1